MRSLESRIRFELGRYLTGETTLREFRGWLASNAWNVEASTPAGELCGEIELACAEFANGHLDEDELSTRLAPLSNTFAITFAGAPRRTLFTGSSSTSSMCTTMVTSLVRSPPSELGCKLLEVESE